MLEQSFWRNDDAIVVENKLASGDFCEKNETVRSEDHANSGAMLKLEWAFLSERSPAPPSIAKHFSSCFCILNRQDGWPQRHTQAYGL